MTASFKKKPILSTSSSPLKIVDSKSDNPYHMIAQAFQLIEEKYATRCDALEKQVAELTALVGDARGVLLDEKEIIKHFGICLSTLGAWQKKGMPIYGSARMRRGYKNELDDWFVLTFLKKVGK